MDDPPHAHPTEQVLDALETEIAGLSTDEAQHRLDAYGENEIVRSGGRSPLDIFLAQFDSVLIWVLLFAALLSTWAGQTVDAVLIVIIVGANGIFGFFQDYRAERSLESLRELAAPTATVRRDGEPSEIEATELVPGDAIVLRSGDVVPADARVISETDLNVDEAALTGESVPVSKTTTAVEADTPLAERKGMVYKATNVTRGKGAAVVTATGMATEVGDIAGELAGTEETETPLQSELDDLGRSLGIGILLLSALVAPLLILRGTGAVQAALTAVSLAVAAIPEGLPAVVTLTLAIGVRGMADENALVRRLPAVEALGSVDVICTDKTGTLTRGEMTVRRLWVNDAVVAGDEVTHETESAGTHDPTDREALLVRIGALCNDATLEGGDPTEVALVEAADRRGLDVEGLRTAHPRSDEIPFSSDRKWMGTVHDDVGYVKGAPEIVVENCDRVLTAEGAKTLTDAGRERIASRVEAFADDALRVLGMATCEQVADADDLRDGLTFVGLVGMIDPAREEVADAIAATERAGIDVKMVTGDNVRTATAVGETLGFESTVLEGREIESMADDELRERVDHVDVFARTSPEHKVRILRALQARGHRVAMTGDGVNDAPALKNADVGVAMGVRGTDVARQSADVVLLDDNYATIERAVERGRAIFDNVWKFVAYLLSANAAEVAIVFVASLYGYLLLPAVQLLWINLLTDGLPALALGADPGSEDVMDRPPRGAGRGIVDREMLEVIGATAAVTTVVVLGLAAYALGGASETTAYAMTMVFTAFVVVEFEKLYVIRRLRETPTVTNPWLAAAIATSLVAQLAVLYTPLNRYFGTVALGPADWGILGGVVGLCLVGHLVVTAALRNWRSATG
ncbi:cation transport ATPase [Halovivax ruber XH-70]|uniref:Cation transport ATPase n=1 Tax=Halovivax ruber (strain DSM 18193 / JCM 13892 / XH-70) TaxID=797302 RepID=L0ICJ1_HALRX|nr:cation-translocating P-type ATPase [Halovivax ruber]AGB15936.1 cation transport ATPase [Halovivax ruber XH-70]